MGFGRDTVDAPRSSPQPPVLQLTPAKREKISQHTGFLMPSLSSKGFPSSTSRFTQTSQEVKVASCFRNSSLWLFLVQEDLSPRESVGEAGCPGCRLSWLHCLVNVWLASVSMLLTLGRPLGLALPPLSPFLFPWRPQNQVRVFTLVFLGGREALGDC